MREDLYATLGVEPGATLEQIETAYRRLARQYHPDVNPSPEAATRMREINQAYRELRDPLRRADYDRRRVQTRRAASPEQGAAWEQFAEWDAPRPAPSPPPPAAPTWHMPSVSLSVIVGAVLVLLLAGLVLVFNTSRPSATAQGVAPTVVTLLAPPTPTTGATINTATRQPNVALAAAEPTRTPTTAPPTATRTAAPATSTPTRPSATPSASATATDLPPTATSTATVAPTGTGTPTAAPTRAATPPLNVLAGDFYNEQETPAGGRKFQIKLTILNQGTQTLVPPWRPRFLVMASDRQKGWVDASYYGPAQGGTDISRQPPIAPGQQQAWSWYHVTAGPDEWIRQIEFVGLGWRWTWTFDRVFQNPQVSVTRP